MHQTWLTILCLSLSLFTLTTFAQGDIMLKHQIAQMLIVGFDGKHVSNDHPIVNAIHAGIGGVILFDQDYHTKKFDKNIESPQQVKALNAQLQDYAHQAAQQHGWADVPLFISVDYEGGRVNRLKTDYGFPATQSASDLAKGNLADAATAAGKMGDTLHSAGFNVDFAPMLDVNTNPDNPIIAKLGRSFSDDASVVADYAAVFSEQFHQRGIYCAYKHFPGHGSSTEDSHLGFVDVTETWQTVELMPYKLLFERGAPCDFVMTAHIINRQLDPSDLPATLSKPVLTDLLRHELGYQGIIITDDMQMQAITNHFDKTDAMTKAINAGADMLIFGNQLSATPQDPLELVEIIYQQVQAGHIAEGRITDAYKRIIRVKQKYSSRS